MNLTKRKQISGLIPEIIIVTGAVVCSTPILSSKAMFYVLVSILYLYYIILNWRLISVNRNNKIVLNTTAFLLIVIIYRVIGISDAGLSRYVMKLAFFLPVFIMLTIPDRMFKKSIKRIFWLSVLVATVNILYNIYLGILYPAINTRVVREMMEDSALENLNVGGSPYYTFTLFFFSACFFIFLNSNKKIEKYLMLLVALISAIYICWFCYKASVVVFLFVTVFFLYFAKYTRHTIRFFVISGIACLFILIIVSFFLNEIIEILISISPNERLTVRLVSLIDSENVEAYGSTLQGRESLALLSAETWLSAPSNFLIGIGDHYVVGESSISTGIGQHAELLDGLAQYGILGMIPLLVLLFYSMKYVASKFRKECRLQIIVIFCIFILCGFAKYIFLPAIGYVLFIFLPLSAHFTNVENQKKFVK